MTKYANAHVRIEPKGGGITLEQSLNKQILAFNLKRRNNNESVLSNLITTFKVPLSLSKHEKIATLLPAYNQGRLKFRRNAVGIDQIKNELRKYNPDRKANDDNCIDALSGITWQQDIYAYENKDRVILRRGNSFFNISTSKWRI